MTCFQCGAPRGDTDFCTSCGSRFPKDSAAPSDDCATVVSPVEVSFPVEPKCSKCGATQGHTIFCTTCGSRFPEDSAALLIPTEPPAWNPSTEAGDVPPTPNSPVASAPAGVPPWNLTKPDAPPPTKRTRRKVMALVAAAVLITGLIPAGVLLGAKKLTGEDSVDPTSASNSDSRSDTSKNDKNVTGQPTETAPTKATLKNTCWNGAVVDHGTDCSSRYDKSTLFYAFGVKESDCHADKGSAWNDLSYKCSVSGATLHLARYRSTSARDSRLAEYGSCDPFGGDRSECNPGGTAPRYVLKYDAADLLFYASSKDEHHDALSTLRGRQKSAAEIRFGTPMAG